MDTQIQIDFSDENVTTLAELTDSLGDVLIHSHFGGYVDQLSQIRLAAERRDSESFRKNVISRALFGGAGALWEIWIEDINKRMEFNKRFTCFVDHLKKMGINNPRIDQVREGFK